MKLPSIFSSEYTEEDANVICKCGHLRANHLHLHLMPIIPRWCEFNQKLCDCWKYAPVVVVADK
jgi:diadenosine tetraphosphate (Ap4A) HIT family hydrolase